MGNPIPISKADAHEVVDLFWKAKMNALDATDPGFFYKIRRCRGLWQLEKRRIDQMYALTEEKIDPKL